ncbi:MAG: DUF3592 domain-containing protein [Chloroflexi bacterium]|jgi:hypothetical protein|nr:DUF3592 domain-containing protein [Chloroflexota bacterium]
MSRRTPVKPKFRNVPGPDTQKQDNTRRGVAMLIMLVLAGYALYNVYVGSQSVLATNAFLLNAQTTQGTITRIEQISGRGGGNYPVVSFQDNTGKTQTFTHHVGCGRSCPAINSSTLVYYETAKPDIAIIDGFLNTWYSSIELFCISFIALLGAGVAFIYTLPRRTDLPSK